MMSMVMSDTHEGMSRPGSLHTHLHMCEVCDSTGGGRLKMCSCAEAFYCGPDHQTVDWKYHKKLCHDRRQKNLGIPPNSMAAAEKYLLQHHDASIVEIASSALLKDDVNVNFADAFETTAIVLILQQRHNSDLNENMDLAFAANRIPPFEISHRGVHTLLQKDEARHRGLDRDFLEDPLMQAKRKRRNQFGVTVIFQPSGRIITKRVKHVQLGAWELKQSTERRTQNPPIVYWSILTTNGVIRRELLEERKKREEEELRSLARS